MPRYLRPASHGKTTVAVCGRCGFKMYRSELRPDRNAPGLLVCDGCNDLKDPYRLPAPKPENITVMYPRPDEPLVCPAPEEEL